MGGAKRNDNSKSSSIYTYDERSRRWKQIVLPMPTARDSLSVLSHQSALIVVGGDVGDALSSYYSNKVEIFKPDTSQWYRTDPLPTACQDISLVVIGNTCYAIAGYNDSYLKQVLYMPQLMISLAMLYQPNTPTVVVVTLSLEDTTQHSNLSTNCSHASW